MVQKHTMRQPAACLALLLLVACGDDDGSVLDAGLDAGPDAASPDAASPDADVPTDGSVEDGGRDAGASDGGTDGGSGWPSAPTELSVPAGGVPSNVGAPSLVETSGGFGVALHRATTAGEQAWVTVYDPGAEAWGTPRLLPGRDARLAASGDAAMVVYVSCRRAGCDNGDDLFAERFTETGGWEEAAQLDVLPSGSSLTGVDANILYPHVVGDGAGGFLAAWNHQSANLTLYASGAAGPGFESTAPADWTTPGVSPLFTADGDGGATLVWGRAYLERAIAVVLDADASGAFAAPEPVPASSGARGQVAAARGGAVAVASTYDLGGSALPDGLRLLYRDAAGTWSVSELIASTEDWLLTPRLVPFGAGFVALWQERTGAEGIVRAAIHTGSGGWGDPITLEDDALTQLDDGPSLALSANDDAVVATWVGATSDLRAAVLTDLDAGFGSPSALREETASTLQAVRATAGPTGHLVVFLEENGSEERTYRARVHAGGTWSAVTEPFGALTEADRSYSLVGDPSALAVAWVSGAGVQVARWVEGSWSASEVLAGADFAGGESTGLFASAAGLRVVSTQPGDDRVYSSRLHDGTEWGSPTTFTLTDGRSAFVEAGRMNGAGDVAFLGYGDEGDPEVALLVLRADGALETTSLGSAVGRALLGVTPNDRFLVARETRGGDVGAQGFALSAGY